MTPDLDPAKAILRSFLAEIEKVKSIQQNISEPQMATAFSVQDQQPIFNSNEFSPAPASFWEKDNAYMLLYADAWDFRAYMHRPKPNAIPEYYQQPALPIYH